MSDAALIWDDDIYAGDLSRAGADLVREEGLRTAVIVSLFSDARAEAVDVSKDEDLRGWWADALGAGDDRIGSRLWLLARAKQTAAVPVRAEEYARDALEWMVEDGIADRVDVSAAWAGQGRLCIEIAIVRGGATRFAEAFAMATLEP